MRLAHLHSLRGIRHSAPSRSNSCHSAALSSAVRTKVSRSSSAIAVSRVPVSVYGFNNRLDAVFGNRLSVLGFGVWMAPSSMDAGSVSARIVAMPYRNTRLHCRRSWRAATGPLSAPPRAAIPATAGGH
jgi:hypothetical protein